MTVLSYVLEVTTYLDFQQTKCFQDYVTQLEDSEPRLLSLLCVPLNIDCILAIKDLELIKRRIDVK